MRSPEHARRPAATAAVGMSRLQAVRLAVAFLATLAAGISLSQQPAAAHSSFLESTPAPGARLTQSPERIVMTYTEPLNERLTEVRLVAATSGERVPAAGRVTEGRRLELRPESALARGAYRLDWRSVSTIDGHIREGSIGFGVGTAAVGAAVELEQSPLAGAGPVRAALRWLFYLALFFFAGGALNALLLSRRGSLGGWLAPDGPAHLGERGVQPHAIATRAAARTGRAAALAAAGAVIVTVVEAADAAGGLSLARMGDFLTGGLAGYARLLTVAALVAAAVIGRRRPVTAALLAALALYGVALGGHASGADNRVLAVGTDWVHLVAAAIWAGGIAQLAWAWLPTLRAGDRNLRRAVLRTVLPRFGRVALPAFVVVAATGLVNALIQLGDLGALWSSAYGRVLAVKIGLVAAAGVLSYVHAFRLRPRLLGVRPGQEPDDRVERVHRRALGGEAPLGAVVLVAAALLVAFPVPPREVREAQAAVAPAVRACDPCPLPTPAEDELAVGAAVGRLTVGAWLREAGGGLEATLRVLDRNRRPVDAPIVVAGVQRRTSCGTGCSHVRLARQPKTLEVAIVDGGERRRVEFPARWVADGNARAREVLRWTQRRMRRLDTFRQVEVVQSAAAGGPAARTDLEFQAPNRTRYESATSAAVIIGRRMWLRADEVLGWQPAPAGEEFRLRDGFRWTVFSETVRLLGVKERNGRRLAQLALLDWGYPVWYRLTVDLESGYAREAQLTTPENRIEHRYLDFEAPLEIEPPVRGRRALR